ncbi:Coenzyme F420 hydrogenase/dehydrogenase, beta subunit C-terminal domain [Desulfocurvibacter africanus]|uniref:Coenzyme F420 hydrogenase/dehydrogenase, beta subunit C-terminal domain n=1 Tax=Desulfocurvibacter africanus TaxID=873 RepID=UPI000686A44D|nr:Coenzyme F420 hydrogenase/dehydrogenase, beta subunit C-terminal domain [Desulfocurvibacter africanus]
MRTNSTKSFHDLMAEVIEPGLCSNCSGCVSFCSAMGYGALETGPEGEPRFRNPALCIECGICHLICPETGLMEADTRARLNSQAPMGAVRNLTFARAKAPEVTCMASHGGAVTALLLHLLDTKQIYGAIVNRREGIHRKPVLARSAKDLLLSAGHYPAVSNGPALLGELYQTLSVRECAGSLAQGWLHKVAFVGLPDQILALRNMETLGIIPSDAVALYVGLFCDEAYQLGITEQLRLEQAGKFNWENILRFTCAEELKIHLDDGRVVTPPERLRKKLSMKGCSACTDYSAELADISFGGLGAPNGWTTVVVRTERGQKAFQSACGTVLEEPSQSLRQRQEAQRAIEGISRRKRERAAGMRQEQVAVSGV